MQIDDGAVFKCSNELWVEVVFIMFFTLNVLVIMLSVYYSVMVMLSSVKARHS